MGEPCPDVCSGGVTPHGTWNCSLSLRDAVLRTHQGSIDRICRMNRGSSPCCFPSCVISWIPGPVAFAIVFIGLSPAVAFGGTGSATTSTQQGWRNCPSSAAHPGQVEVEASCEVFHALLHCGG